VVYDTSNSGIPSNDVWSVAIEGNGTKWMAVAGGRWSSQKAIASFDGSKITTTSFDYWQNSKLRIIDFDSRVVLEEHIISNHGSKIEWSPEGKWISLGFHGFKSIRYLFNYEKKLSHLSTRWIN